MKIKMQTINPCAHCGNKKDFWVYWYPFKPRKQAVQCGKCLAIGPPAQTRVWAVRKWNWRLKGMK